MADIPVSISRVTTKRSERGRGASLASLASLLCMLACLTAASASGQSAEIESAVLEKRVQTLRVFGSDERQPVADTAQLPWSAVGQVESVWHKGENLLVISTGTGTLIGNRVVLTGGHVVYSQEDGWADEVTFIPARNGTLEPFGRAYSVRTIAQRAWVENNDNRYDLALMVLDRPIGEQAGYLPVAVEPDSFFVERNFNSAGYPGETKPGDEQYHSYGRSLDVQDGLIRHLIDSEPGQSGSPLWYYEPETQKRRVVGVLTGSREIASGGQVVDAYNVAIQINTAFAGWIDETLAAYDSGVEDVAVTEHSASAEPAACGVGAPVAAAVLTVCLLCVISSRGRRSACPFASRP